jgi:hypothetical protein
MKIGVDLSTDFKNRSAWQSKMWCEINHYADDVDYARNVAETFTSEADTHMSWTSDLQVSASRCPTTRAEPLHEQVLEARTNPESCQDLGMLADGHYSMSVTTN